MCLVLKEGVFQRINIVFSFTLLHITGFNCFETELAGLLS